MFAEANLTPEKAGDLSAWSATQPAKPVLTEHLLEVADPGLNRSIGTWAGWPGVVGWGGGSPWQRMISSSSLCSKT